MDLSPGFFLKNAKKLRSQKRKTIFALVGKGNRKKETQTLDMTFM